MNIKFHCVKSVQIRNFFWSVFSRIRPEFGDLQSKYWKIPFELLENLNVVTLPISVCVNDEKILNV